MRQKSGSGSFVAVVIVRCCIKNLSFSVNALAQSRPDQRGLGDFPKTAVKIALSKSIISATVGEPAAQDRIRAGKNHSSSRRRAATTCL